MTSFAGTVNKSDNYSTDERAGSEITLEEKVKCDECLLLCWKAKIITVEPVTFLYMLGTYFSLSFTFQYYYQRYARDRLSSVNHTLDYTVQHHFCITYDYLSAQVGPDLATRIDDSAENDATHLTFLTGLCSMLMSIVSTVFMGPLTDRFGRKFAITSANFGSMISSLLVMIIVYYELDLHYFIAASVISSFFGGFGVLLMGTFSYIADISSYKTRSLRIGILELMIYISSALTSVLTGIWISEVDCDFAPVTWAPFICYIINTMYAFLVLPESLSKAQRQAKAKKAGGNRLTALWKGILLYFRPKLVTLKLWICLTVLLVVIVNITGSTVIGTYFYIHQPLKWAPEQIGLYGGYSSVTHGLALLVVMPIALVIGVPDVGLAIIGVLCSCLGYLLTAGVRETWQMYASKLVSISQRKVLKVGNSLS